MSLILKALKSKMIWFSIALATLSVLQGYIGILPLSVTGQAIAGCIVAACITVLRFITTTSIANK
jgi:hypothetical protein